VTFHVYRHYDNDGVLLYVGQSNNVSDDHMRTGGMATGMPPASR